MSEQDLPKEKLVIIGSGPAGWTAAIYAARASLDPLVFAGRSQGTLLAGGQLMLTTDVENYPGFPDGVTGPEMMQKFFEQAARFDTRVVTDEGPKKGSDIDSKLFSIFQDVKSVDLSERPFRVVGDGGYKVLAESVIIATGASAKWLGLENEERLAKSGGGVSACAVCDGALPMFRDSELGVVGAGDTAVEEALYLTKFASKVHMFVRRDEMRASKVMQERALNSDKIEMHWHTEVIDIHGDDKITGVRLINNQTQEERDMDLGGLFMAIGHTPITGFLDGQLKMDDTGYLVLPNPGRSMTDIEGVFAAGDVSDHIYRQAVTAAGMGCKAAIDAERWLENQE
ncbi:MAG: NAD(P)/FAD-dependent oxidoreductase [Phycisphaeraceae bacterium]